MSSFIDLMADDDWSDADILNRTEAMKRTRYSDQDEAILNRKVAGMLAGRYMLTPAEQAEVADFDAVVVQLQQLHASALADRDLLRAARVLEAAQSDLDSLPPAPTDGSTDPYSARRAADQAVIAAASQEALDLAGARAAQRAGETQ